MSDDTQHELDAVLDAFVAAGPASLDRWVARFPQFEQELTDFAVSWQISETLPASPDAEQVADDVIVQRGLRAVRDLLGRRQFQTEPASRHPSAAAVPIRSLLEEARTLGLRPRQFAAAAGMGETLLAKLDRGLIRFASIPSQAFQNLASALRRDVSSIQAYLEQKGPTMAPLAAFKAEQAPEVGQPEDFFSAVETDLTLGAEVRQHWLDLAQPPDHL